MASCVQPALMACRPALQHAAERTMPPHSCMGCTHSPVLHGVVHYGVRRSTQALATFRVQRMSNPAMCSRAAPEQASCGSEAGLAV